MPGKRGQGTHEGGRVGGGGGRGRGAMQQEWGLVTWDKMRAKTGGAGEREKVAKEGFGSKVRP